MRYKLCFIGLITISVIIFALFHGNETIKSQALFSAIFSNDQPIAQQILINLRLPRVFSALVTGGLLALSGCLMQALLQNPLADPYILGVAGGAALGALSCTILGLSSLMIIVASWTGSLIIIAIVWALSIRQLANNEHMMLLTGIALASLASAFVSLILILSRNTALHGMLFWLMGDLSGSNWPIMGGLILIFGFIYSMKLADQLNILVCGKQEAAALGISLQKLHLQLYLLASLLAATAVTIAGCIGFIGLIVPHILRLSISDNHRYLLPCATIIGAIWLTFADTCAQVLFSPLQLPVGIIMTVIGVPIFLFLLKQNIKQN